MAYTVDFQLVSAGNKPLEPNRRTSDIATKYSKISSPWVGMTIYSESDEKLYIVRALDNKGKIKSAAEGGYEELSGVGELVDPETRLILAEKLPEGYEKGVAGGIASLDPATTTTTAEDGTETTATHPNAGRVPKSQLPTDVAYYNEDGIIPSGKLPQYVSDVSMRDKKNSSTEGETCFPGLGNKSAEQPKRDVIYVDRSTNLPYRWGGTDADNVSETDYVEISQSLALDANNAGLASAAYPADKGKKNADDITAINTTLNRLDNKYVKKVDSPAADKTYVVVNNALQQKDFIEQASSPEQGKTYVVQNNVLVKKDVPDVYNNTDKVASDGSALDAYQGKLLKDDIGKLSYLKTDPDSRDNLVAAINNLYNKIQSIDLKITKADEVHLYISCQKKDSETIAKFNNLVEQQKSETGNNKLRVKIGRNDYKYPDISLLEDGRLHAYFSVNEGNEYTIKFQLLDGCADIDDITQKAGGYGREFNVEYKIPSVNTNEEVRVTIYNESRTPILWEGIDVHYQIDGEGDVVHNAITNENGNIPPFFVKQGKKYKIWVESPVVRSYTDPSTGLETEYNYEIQGSCTQEFTAETLIRSVVFTYASSDFGIFIVDADGKTYNYEVWKNLGDSRKVAKYAKFVTPDLKNYGGVFFLRISDLRANYSEYPTTQFYNVSSVIGTMHQMQSQGVEYIREYYSGWENTINTIKSYSDPINPTNPGSHSTACESARLKDHTFCGIKYKGFVPAASQFDVVNKRYSVINDILSKNDAQIRFSENAVFGSNYIVSSTQWDLQHMKGSQQGIIQKTESVRARFFAFFIEEGTESND